MKRLTCTLATLALVMCTYIPAHAEWLGKLPRDQEFTIEITNAVASTTAVTIYYVDRRGLDVIATMTVIGTNPTQETLPKPGQGVRRVIIQVDPTPGHQAQLRLNQGAPITIEAGIQLVLDVV
jgi:hypothetical protein